MGFCSFVDDTVGPSGLPMATFSAIFGGLDVHFSVDRFSSAVCINEDGSSMGFCSFVAGCGRVSEAGMFWRGFFVNAVGALDLSLVAFPFIDCFSSAMGASGSGSSMRFCPLTAAWGTFSVSRAKGKCSTTGDNSVSSLESFSFTFSIFFLSVDFSRVSRGSQPRFVSSVDEPSSRKQ